ncbi:MAG: DNA helicase RecQ [Alphaproteobacteria bacterium]|nr:DNA helicase RecQ [Alphaproteobacteria bacterium]
MPTLDVALALLKSNFGYDRFRPGQADIVRALLAGESVLAVMPTGSGKSMCYQLPALATESLTVVVSPLIALMRDQVAALRLSGVAAGALNSATPRADAAETHRQLRDGRLRLLYISPERLMQPNVLDGLARHGPARFAIDEAHCISQWGHDFRPDYRRLAELPEHFPDARLGAFTATADTVTRQDIVERLFGGRAKIFVAGFDRPNLQIGIAPRNSAARQIDALLELHPGRSGIVYTLSRKQAERTAQRLSSRERTALPYHAGLDQAVRDRNQDRFLTEDGIVMVATIAFGMGIDKPDVRFVVHANIPSTVEAYYQEIGRAGRDGLPAETLMLYGMDDIRIRRLMIDDSDRPDEAKRVEHQRLNALLTLCEAAGCRRQTLLGYFGDSCDPCGNCDRCLAPVETIDGTVIAQKALSAALRTGERFGAQHLVDVLRGEETKKVLQFHHDRLPTFGVGADIGKPLWRSYLRQLVAADVLKIDIGGYGALQLGGWGRAVLKGAETVALHGEAARPPKERIKAAERPPENVDPALFARLKQVRLEIANAEGVPAFVVLHDRSLLDMAAHQPQSLEQLAGCHGVGALRLERYGERFLAALKDTADTKPSVDVALDAEQARPAVEPVLAGDFDARLFHRLKALRHDIAQAEDMPPYEVLHKFSLQEMAVNQPQTLDALAECYGVDAEKLERYGDRFLAVLNAAKSVPATSDNTHDPEWHDPISESDLSDRHDPELFARLKELRIEIAQAEEMSPLAVFPDRTLMEMTVLLPHTPDALAECHGVGPRKLERYGARFLDEIRANDQSSNEQQDLPRSTISTSK